MVGRILSIGAAAALLGASSVLASTPASCSLTNKCPQEAPCCSRTLFHPPARRCTRIMGCVVLRAASHCTMAARGSTAAVRSSIVFRLKVY